MSTKAFEAADTGHGIDAFAPGLVEAWQCKASGWICSEVILESIGFALSHLRLW